MGKSKDDIKVKIEKYLSKAGVKKWSEVYVGIAEDPKDRLFSDHKVKQNGVWIYCQANSSDCAREVEQELLAKGAKGGPGGGSDNTIYVYAYKTEVYTKQ